MKTLQKTQRTALIAAALLGILTLGAATFFAMTPLRAWAHDDDDCKVPMAQWQSREALSNMARTQGWTVDRIKVDDGCYEIRGADKNGLPFKAKIDPGTLAVIEMKSGERHRRREHQDGARPALPAASAPAAPPASAASAALR